MGIQPYLLNSRYLRIMSKTKFTTKQRLFIDYYLATLNAYESAKQAGYKGNYKTLRNIGSENLAKHGIRAEIDRRLAELIPDPNETLARIGKQARSTMGDFLVGDDDYGHRLSLDRAELHGAMDVIKKYKETETTRRDKDGNEYTTLRREVELYPADSALDKLMKYHGLYKADSDYRSEIVKGLQDGSIKPADIALVYPSELAQQFFAMAGVTYDIDD